MDSIADATKRWKAITKLHTVALKEIQDADQLGLGMLKLLFERSISDVNIRLEELEAMKDE